MAAQAALMTSKKLSPSLGHTQSINVTPTKMFISSVSILFHFTTIVRAKSNHLNLVLNNRELLYKEKLLAKQIKFKIQANKWRIESLGSTYSSQE
jgi:hypothetical protein